MLLSLWERQGQEGEWEEHGVGGGVRWMGVMEVEEGSGESGRGMEIEEGSREWEGHGDGVKWRPAGGDLYMICSEHV